MADVVVVNQWTLKRADGTGSFGSTPGDYLSQYMAREDAVEPIAPMITTDIGDFVTKYAARQQAVQDALPDLAAQGISFDDAGDYPFKLKLKKTTEHSQSDTSDEPISVDQVGYATDHAELLSRISTHMRLAGVAFGNGDIALSDEELQNRSDHIQDLFDSGKTILKTVVSFDGDYLKKMNVVDKDFHLRNPGDYRGKVDQMKLRHAIMYACERLGSTSYDDLYYVGVIQVDTNHVHCHLVMADAGVGTLTQDGTQKGNISQKDLKAFKRYVDADLERQAGRTPVASAVGYEKRNLALTMRKWTYETMVREADTQFLYAVLPRDRSLWKVNSGLDQMRKADELARDIVLDRLDKPGSVYDKAVKAVEEYAAKRVSDGSFDEYDREEFIASEKEQLIVTATNAMYHVLAQVPEEKIFEATAVMKEMSLSIAPEDKDYDLEDDDFNIGQFGIRMRSYASRREKHKQKADDYDERLARWNQAYQDGRALEASRVMAQFYAQEAMYHHMAASKYDYFLPPVDRFDDFSNQYDQIIDYAHSLTGLKAMRNDSSIMRLGNAAEAERIGRRVYGHKGAHQLSRAHADRLTGRKIIDERIARMENRLQSMVDDFKAQAVSSGVRVVVDEPELLARVGYESSSIAPDDETMVHKLSRRVSKYPGVADEVDKQVKEAAYFLRHGINIPDPFTPGVPAQLEAGGEYEFSECKMIDMHDMGYDWLADREVSERNIEIFVDMATRRKQKLVAARLWLEETGQHSMIAKETMDAAYDISRMEDAAVSLKETKMLYGAVTNSQRRADAPRILDEVHGAETYRLHEKVIHTVDQHVGRAIDEQVVARMRDYEVDQQQASVQSDRALDEA